MRSTSALLALLALLALSGCSHRTVTEETTEESWVSTSLSPETIARVERRPDGNLGAGSLVLVGARAEALEPGHDYRLQLALTEQPGVRTVVDARKVLRIVGTLEDDGDGMRLVTVQARSVSLTGDVVVTYRSIRDALREHDYSRTLFAVDAVEELHAPGRYTWLGYKPVPTYQCVRDEATLELVSVQKEGALLDGFVAMRAGREEKIGAHVACSAAHGGRYACNLDAIGQAVGEAHFAPGPRFSFALPDGPELACSTVDRAAVAATSEL